MADAEHLREPKDQALIDVLMECPAKWNGVDWDNGFTAAEQSAMVQLIEAGLIEVKADATVSPDGTAPTAFKVIASGNHWRKGILDRTARLAGVVENEPLTVRTGFSINITEARLTPAGQSLQQDARTSGDALILLHRAKIPGPHEVHQVLIAEKPSATAVEPASAPTINESPVFRFCLHNGGARFDGFSQSAVLDSLKGIPRLHAIVYAGPRGARMADLVGVAAGDELGSRDDAFDTEGRNAIMARLERLEHDRAEAEELGNSDEGTRIRHEQLEITKRLHGDQTRRGGARDINSRVNNWRATISDSLDTVYAKLRKQQADLIADHFRAYITSTGTDEQTAAFVYNPPAGTLPWQDGLT